MDVSGVPDIGVQTSAKRRRWHGRRRSAISHMAPDDMVVVRLRQGNDSKTNIRLGELMNYTLLLRILWNQDKVNIKTMPANPEPRPQPPIDPASCTSLILDPFAATVITVAGDCPLCPAPFDALQAIT